MTDTLYTETYRPQFHFTAAQGWLNDPNGLVFYEGEYHLFFQHNPFGTEWGHMTWGHAVSPDLLHWRQLPHALLPDHLGTMFSGCAVVDWQNTAGFQGGADRTLVALYTAAGGTSPESDGHPFTQCLASSTDRGRTWAKYAGNPVLPHIVGGNRDPKVTWHAGSQRWVMALYLDGHDYAFFASPDLKTWTHLHNMAVCDCTECPDFFEMPVDGTTVDGTTDDGRRHPERVDDSSLAGHDRQSKDAPAPNHPDRRWVWTAANGRYLVGTFDGQRFTPEAEHGSGEYAPHIADWGANYYAVQTFSDMPDGRRIQIAWMAGGQYPGMPFNQQMSFPCELTLHRTPEGFRLRRRPAREVARLHEQSFVCADVPLGPEPVWLADTGAAPLHIVATFALGDAAEAGLRVHGEPITYDTAAHLLTCLGRSAPCEPLDGTLQLEVLVDRTSIEVFANQGRVSLTSCCLPTDAEPGVSAYATGGAARLQSLEVHTLRSIWS